MGVEVGGRGKAGGEEGLQHKVGERIIRGLDFSHGF